MTKDECHEAFAAKIKACIQDEHESADGYEQMAEEIEGAHPGSPWAAVMRDMSHEEACHARHLEQMLSEMDGR